MSRSAISGGVAPRPAPASGGGFIVICDARAGSGFLCSCLDSHPELACHHELFNPEFVGSRHGVGTFHNSGQTDPLIYIADMQQRTRDCSGARLVGFKLHFRHAPELLEQILDDSAQRIILLSRRDRLAQWGSYRLAQVTDQWSRPNNDSDLHPVTRIPFNLRPFSTYLVHQRAWETRVLRRRPDCLCVVYENIVPPGSLSAVLRFLGAEPQPDLGVTSRRQFTGKSTYQRFTNPLWAAVGSRMGYALARLIDVFGATPLVHRLTRY